MRNMTFVSDLWERWCKGVGTRYMKTALDRSAINQVTKFSDVLLY